MIPRWFERGCVLSLLLLGVWLRLYDLTRLPLGFSDEEITSITITKEIRSGTIQVFFPIRPQGGQESFYHTLNSVVTRAVGDGLLGFRALSLWSNLLALALLYMAARALFGAGIGLVALALMTTGIWSILLGRSASAVTLVPLFVTGMLAAMVWTFRLHKPIAPTPPSTAAYTALGFGMGVALYAHYTGVLLGAVVLVFVLYLWQTKQPVSRWVWSSSLYMLTLIAVVGLPYLISVLRNPDLSGVGLFWRQRPESVLGLAESLVKTVGGFFYRGDSDPSHNVPVLPLMPPIWFLLSVVGFIYGVRRWREPAYGLILIALGVGLLPDIWLREGPDFSAMLLLQPILYIYAGLGTYVAARYVQSSRVMGGWRFVAFLAFLGFLWSAWQAYDRLLVEWPGREDVRVLYHSDVAQLTTYLDRSPEDLPTLICVNNLDEAILPSGNLRWSEPQLIEDMLHREDLELRYAACRSSFVFIHGGEPMRVLLVGTRLLSEATPAVRVWFDQLQPLSVEGIPSGIVNRLDAGNALAQLGGQFQLDSPLFYPLTGSEPEKVSLPVRFGRNITLLGAIPPDSSVYPPGGIVVVTSYWRIDGTPPQRLGIFARLHDNPQSSPYTETNVLDVIPDDLEERDVILQTSFMPLPETLPPGEYVLTLGAYDNNPLNQIPVFDAAAAQVRGDYLSFEGRLVIEAAEK